MLTASQQKDEASLQDSLVDEIWRRVDRELKRRRTTWAELGRAIEVSKQTLTNWKIRGIPAHAHIDIAESLGWSIDRLLGREEPPAPTPVFSETALRAAILIDQQPEELDRRRGLAVLEQLYAKHPKALGLAELPPPPSEPPLSQPPKLKRKKRKEKPAG